MLSLDVESLNTKTLPRMDVTTQIFSVFIREKICVEAVFALTECWCGSWCSA